MIVNKIGQLKSCKNLARREEQSPKKGIFKLVKPLYGGQFSKLVFASAVGYNSGRSWLRVGRISDSNQN